MSALTDAVKNWVDIVDVASRYLTLRRSWSNFVALSPFKKERTPSFVVSPQKQIFKCFSTGIGGNVITLVMELEKIDFMDAIKMLAEIGNIQIEQYLENYSYDKEYWVKKEWIKRMNRIVYEWAMKKFPWSEAEKYVKQKRKLTDDMIQQYSLGYLPDSYNDLLHYLVKHWFTEEDMLVAGLAKKNDKWLFSFFRHRLIFPIWDHMGNVIAFGARSLSEEQQPKYLNTPDTALYDKSKVLYGINYVKKNIKDFQKLIVVEWYMDVIALSVAWFPIAVATCWTSLTKQHVQQMQRYTNDVLFLFDNDEAGLQATIRWLKLAYSRDVFPRMMTIVWDAKDIDDVVRQKWENAHNAIAAMIENATDWFKRVFGQLQERSDWSPVQQQKLQWVMFDLLQSMHSLTVQMHYLQFLSDQLGINESYLKAQYTQYVKSWKKRTPTRQKNEEKKPEWYRPKKSILLASLLYQDFADSLLDDSSLWPKMKDLLHWLHVHHGDDLFALVVQQKELSVEDIAKLEEEQLRREQELAKLSERQTKDAMLRKVLLDEVNRLVKITIKSPSLVTEEKQKFFEQLRNVLM